MKASAVPVLPAVGRPILAAWAGPCRWSAPLQHAGDGVRLSGGDDLPARRDIATTTTGGRLLCPVCWAPFTRIRRQIYCSDACRKTAWARRNTTPAPDPAPVPPPRRRRDVKEGLCRSTS